MASLSDLFGNLWSMLISKLLRRWLGLSLKAFPKIGLYIRCLSVRWWSCIRLQRNASYSHSDTLQMRRQVVQAHTSGQELFVRQAEEQAGNNRNQLMASTFNIDIYKTIHQVIFKYFLLKIFPIKFTLRRVPILIAMTSKYITTHRCI